MFALLAWWLAARPDGARIVELAKERAVSFALAVGVGAVSIWATYLFSFASMPAPEFFAGIGTVIKP